MARTFKDQPSSVQESAKGVKDPYYRPYLCKDQFFDPYQKSWRARQRDALSATLGMTRRRGNQDLQFEVYYDKMARGCYDLDMNVAA